MRYFKSTFLWVIALVAVAGYTYLDFEKTRIEEKEKEEAAKLLPFEKKDVLAIQIEKEADGQKSEIELERWEDGWRIVEPIKAKANYDVVEKFLGHVTASRNDADYVMDPNPSPERLVEFGLARPTLRLTLKVGKDLTPTTLVFGDRAPTMGVAFAMLEGKKPVYRVLADAKAEANKDVYFFRDKSVLRINPVMIDQMVISRPGMNARVALPDTGRWVIEKPIEARADHMKVFELLSMFKNTEVKAFEAESKEDLGRYGLDKPSLELLLWVSGDSEPSLKISVGDRSPEKRGYYCSMSDRDNIFVLEEDVVHAMPRSVNELRSKELFFFDQNKLERVEIHDSTGSVVLVRDTNKNWRRGGLEGEKMDFNLVKEFLNDLMSLRIEEFVEVSSGGGLSEYGLAPPEMRLLMWPEGNPTPISLSVGADTPAGRVYAKPGASEDVVTLDGRVRRILKTYF
ncbi:MAG: DUF4340 domain-containing protein [Candidatus Nitrospinota bacterium M3_3B_026]